jgi:hypothetical protein
MNDATDAAPDDDDAEICVICGRPSTCFYPPYAESEEAQAPSCGNMQCEYRMQAAMDYHDEAGHR